MANKIMDLLEADGITVQIHPWNGLKLAIKAPACVTAFIEMVSTDTV
jgi:hypothetical protein